MNRVAGKFFTVLPGYNTIELHGKVKTCIRQKERYANAFKDFEAKSPAPSNALSVCKSKFLIGEVIMKDIYYRKLSIISIIATMFIVSFIITGCEKEEDKPLDEVILNSPELEEYIIAGADFQQSLAIFEKELNEIDFSNLEATYGENGKKVIHLPSVFPISIEQKVQVFNEKKEALYREFPQFPSLNENTEMNYFQQCIRKSVNVNSEFLKLGINTFQPRLKSNSENSGMANTHTNSSDLFDFLSSCMQYVEVYIIKYTDGTISTYIDCRNTSTSSYITLNSSNGSYYFAGGGSGDSIDWIAHTHNNSPNPSPDDRESKQPGLKQYIYHAGNFYSY